MSRTYLIWGWSFSTHSTSMKKLDLLVVLLDTHTHTHTQQNNLAKGEKEGKKITTEDYGSSLIT